MSDTRQIAAIIARRVAAVLWLSCAVGGLALSAEPSPAEISTPASTQRPANADAMPAVAAPSAKSPAPSPSRSKANAAPPAASAQGARRPASDRLNLDTTVVTGNRELPKVLYIVPWKRADIGDLPPQPFNSLLDEVLTPVDRDVFRREVTYYGAMTGKEGIAAPAAAGSEK